MHPIVVAETADGLGRAIGEVHRRHTRRVNFREGWRGHLWQGPFASFVMDEPHLLAAARYVERNPFKARLADRAVARTRNASPICAGTQRRGSRPGCHRTVSASGCRSRAQTRRRALLRVANPAISRPPTAIAEVPGSGIGVRVSFTIVKDDISPPPATSESVE